MLYISSGGVVIKISTQNEILIKKIKDSKFLYRYIPDVCVSEEKMKFDCEVRFYECNNKDYKLDYPIARINPVGLKIDDVITIIEYILERARQEKGIDTLHSSSVSVNGQGVIFFGGSSGMGKTRMAVSLGNENNSELLSDEKTLLNLTDKYILGGIKTLYISKGDTGIRHGYHTFELESGGKKIPISFFVHAYVEDSSKLYYERWGIEKAEWHFYEELSRKIRGTSRRIKNFSLPLMSLDSFENASKRSARSKEICNTIPFYYMRGSEEKIKNKIINLLNKK